MNELVLTLNSSYLIYIWWYIILQILTGSIIIVGSIKTEIFNSSQIQKFSYKFVFSFYLAVCYVCTWCYK